jgi:hypothetical protein
VIPGLAFPPVGRLGFPSPPSSVLRSATTAICPFRCPLLSLVHRYLVCSLSSCPRFAFKLVGAQERLRQRLAYLVTRYTVSGGAVKETNGSPKFPGYPFKRMPRSSTPVVSSALALAHSGLLPSARLTASAFPLNCGGFLYVHDYTNFEAQSRGLCSRFPWLRTPVTGLTRRGRY